MALKEKIDREILKNKKDDSGIYSIRLPLVYKHTIEKHFRENGLSFSTGVRMVLLQYMRKKNIIS